MVKIRLFGAVATLNGREWESESATAKALLDADLTYFITTTGADPWPEMTIAQDAVKRYGAVIVATVPPVTKEGVVY